MALRVVQFLATILTALEMVPEGAHLFALANKISLPQDQYFVVQQIYRGWALFGIVLFPALAANVALTIMLRHRRPRLLAGPRRVPVRGGDADHLLPVDLSGQCDHQQLDHGARQLGGAAHAVGIRARGQRRAHVHRPVSAAALGVAGRP